MKNAFIIRFACQRMVGIAQTVRAPGCGPGGHGFKSHYPPHKNALGCSQAVRHRTLTPAVRWFESTHPSQLFMGH